MGILLRKTIEAIAFLMAGLVASVVILSIFFLLLPVIAGGPLLQGATMVDIILAFFVWRRQRYMAVGIMLGAVLTFAGFLPVTLISLLGGF